MVITATVGISAAAGPTTVATQHNNEMRTGANLTETELKPHLLTTSKFGKVFTHVVDGQTSAQPLYIPNVPIPGKGIHNAVYVATLKNYVYAFDADNRSGPNANPLWGPVWLGPPVPYNAIPLSYEGFNTQPWIGVMSTPAIDESTGTLYLVARTLEGPNGNEFVFRLWALDITSGAVRGSRVIQASYFVPCCGNAWDYDNGYIHFNPAMHLQRPGLLIKDETVHIAFGGWQDTPKYHGWVFGYSINPATFLTQTYVMNTTPNGERGGIWQAGAGLAGDPASNHLYFMTGNGSFSSVAWDRGTSFVKIGTRGAGGWGGLDYFTPHDEEFLDFWDLDLGSSGPLFIPGTRLVVGGGKQSIAHVVNVDNMGGFTNFYNNNFQNFEVCRQPNLAIFEYGHHLHGSPVFWSDMNSTGNGGLLYYWCEEEELKAFRFDGVRFNPTPERKSLMTAPMDSMPGGQLALSANGNADGILWATHPSSGDALKATRPGILRAFKASDISVELWNTTQASYRDDAGNFAKGAVPTISNGRVYLPTFSDQLHVYGFFNLSELVSVVPPPSLMAPSSSSQVSVGFRNISGRTWTPGRYRLRSQNPEDNTAWGTNRVELPRAVAPGETVTFTFNIVAPAAPGPYYWQWRMVEEGNESFGATTAKVSVQVTNGLGLSVSPTSATILQGSYATYCVAPILYAGYAPDPGAVLAIGPIAGLTSNETWTAAVSTCGGAAGYELKIQTTTGTATGPRTLTINASYNSPYALGQAAVSLNVNAPPVTCTRVFDPETRTWSCE